MVMVILILIVIIIMIIIVILIVILIDDRTRINCRSYRKVAAITISRAY